MPLIPLLAALAGISGAATLIWYYSNSESQRAELDRKANIIAEAWFNKKVKELNAYQAKQVYDEVRRNA